MRRPCLDCGRLAAGSRCTTCQRAREAGRPAYRAAYADPVYRAARRELRGRPCVYCGRPSDTVEHLTPLAADASGGGPGNWAPACRSCNSRRGAR